MSKFLSQDHDEFDDQLVEFALGILDGRTRVRLMEHIEDCSSCTQRVGEYTDTLEIVMALPREVDPDAGFESKVLARIQGIQQRRPSRHWSGRRLIAAAATVVVLSFGVGYGVDHVVNAPHHVVGSSTLTSRALFDGSRRVGTVEAYGRRPSWIVVTLNDPRAKNAVRCTAISTSGRRIDVGFFALRHGRGQWASALSVSWSNVRAVTLATPSGSLIAQTSSSPWTSSSGVWR